MTNDDLEGDASATVAMLPKREPDYDRLQGLIRDDILNGILAGGARLKVGDLAAAYGTSTNPVREALRALEGEGLVVIQPNRGASVRAIDEKFISDVYDLRAMIEPHIVRYFVEMASPSELDALENYQAGCEQGAKLGDHRLFHVNNTRLHDVILDRYYNVEAVKTMRRHSLWLRALNRKHPLTASQMSRSNVEHVEFIEAAHRGDADLAIAVMKRHRQNARRIFLAHMASDLLADQPRPARVGGSL